MCTMVGKLGSRCAKRSPRTGTGTGRFRPLACASSSARLQQPQTASPSMDNVALREAEEAAGLIQRKHREARFRSRKQGTHALRAGDMVKVRLECDEPAYGWGTVTHDSIGPILDIDCDGRVFVDFNDLGWSCMLEDLERAAPAGNLQMQAAPKPTAAAPTSPVYPVPMPTAPMAQSRIPPPPVRVVTGAPPPISRHVAAGSMGPPPPRCRSRREPPAPPASARQPPSSPPAITVASPSPRHPTSRLATPPAAGYKPTRQGTWHALHECARANGANGASDASAARADGEISDGFYGAISERIAALAAANATSHGASSPSHVRLRRSLDTLATTLRDAATASPRDAAAASPRGAATASPRGAATASPRGAAAASPRGPATSASRTTRSQSRNARADASPARADSHQQADAHERCTRARRTVARGTAAIALLRPAPDRQPASTGLPAVEHVVLSRAAAAAGRRQPSTRASGSSSATDVLAAAKGTALETASRGACAGRNGVRVAWALAVALALALATSAISMSNTQRDCVPPEEPGLGYGRMLYWMLSLTEEPRLVCPPRSERMWMWAGSRIRDFCTILTTADRSPPGDWDWRDWALGRWRGFPDLAFSSDS